MCNKLDTLLSEGNGILAWLVEGARLYQEEGLQRPNVVAEATQEMWRERDPVRAFLASNTSEDPAAVTTGAELYAAFLAYCETHNQVPLSQTAFGTRMGKDGFNEAAGTRSKNSDGCQVYRGLRLQSQPAVSVALN